MPCYSNYGERIHEVIKYIPADSPETIKLVNKMRNELDETTCLLCKVIDIEKNKGSFEELPPEVQDWSINHDKDDMDRLIGTIEAQVKTGETSALSIASGIVSSHGIESEEMEETIYREAKRIIKEKKGE